MSPPPTILERAADRYTLVRRRIDELTDAVMLERDLDRDAAREQVFAEMEAATEELYRRTMHVLRVQTGLDAVGEDLFERVALVVRAHASWCNQELLAGIDRELRDAMFDGEAALTELVSRQEHWLGDARDPRIAVEMLAVDRHRQHEHAAHTTTTPSGRAVVTAPVLVAARTAPRARGAGRPSARRARRTTAASSSSSSGDGSDGPAAPPAPAASPALAPRRRSSSQPARVLTVLRRVGDRGTSQIDWLLPRVIDGGRPILSLAARIQDLRRNGHRITSEITKIGDAHLAVYRLRQCAAQPPCPDANDAAQELFDVGDVRRRPASPLDPEVS